MDISKNIAELRKAKKLTQNELQQFYARLKKSGRKKHVEKFGEGLSDRMVRSCHTTCRTALEKAVTEGLIRINPAVGCKLPPKKAKEMQVMTPAEIIRFLTQAKEEGYLFDPAPIYTNDETLEKMRKVLTEISPEDVANAFLYSLYRYKFFLLFRLWRRW